MTQAPGENMTAAKMPGHWLLARLGKKVLRPGGLQLTRQLIDALAIGPGDRIVEFAPGLGATAKLALSRQPASYTGVERDEAAAAIVRRHLDGPDQRCVLGHAEDTGLTDGQYDVVYGEAMLSMQTPERKLRILREAYRILKPGGRYGIHELCVVPDDVSGHTREEIEKQMAHAIHHGVQIPTASGWRQLLVSQGFVIREETRAPMHLLEPKRLIADEGLFGALRFGWNLLKDRDARHRVMAMRKVFKNVRSNLAAIMLVAVKTSEVDE